MRQPYIPLYLHISRSLLSDIREGTLKVGQHLPTRDELAARFEVSRMTITQALRVLKDSGYIAGVPGSHVEVVAVPPPARDLEAELDDLRVRVEALETRRGFITP